MFQEVRKDKEPWKPMPHLMDKGRGVQSRPHCQMALTHNTAGPILCTLDFRFTRKGPATPSTVRLQYLTTFQFHSRHAREGDLLQQKDGPLEDQSVTSAQAAGGND